MTPETLYVLAAVLLLAAIGYGVWQSRGSRRGSTPSRDAATRAAYTQPTRDDFHDPTASPMTPPDSGGQPTRAPNHVQARQGQHIRGMVNVLVVSLLIVGAAFAAMVAVNAGGNDESEAHQPPNIEQPVAG